MTPRIVADWRPAEAAGAPMAVLLPQGTHFVREAMRARQSGTWAWRLESRHGIVLLGVFLFGCGWAQAQAGADHPSIAATIWKWTPLLARGFVFNLAISFLAMALGTIAGFFLGFAQISLLPPVRRGAWLTTHFFRNAPWLVLLFYCMFLLPFQVTVFGVTIPIPDWSKATLGSGTPGQPRCVREEHRQVGRPRAAAAHCPNPGTSMARSQRFIR